MIDWIKDKVGKTPKSISVRNVLDIHEISLREIDKTNASRYRSDVVRIAGPITIFPNPVKVPDLMNSFNDCLQAQIALHPIELAADALYRLVKIHPFNDRNGRTT